MTEAEAAAPLVEAVTLPKDPTPAVSTPASSDAPPGVSDKPVAAVLDLQLVPQLVCVQRCLTRHMVTCSVADLARGSAEGGAAEE